MKKQVIILIGLLFIAEAALSESKPEKFGSQVCTQIGIIVKDVQKTAEAYADLFGIDVPNVMETDSYEKAGTTYLGKPSEGRAKLAFFDLGSLQLELIEPVGGPSTWQEFLDEKGEGVHHIAFKIDGMDEQIGILGQKGMPLLQRGCWDGGCYSYVDGTEKLKVILELLEFDE